MKDLVDEYAGFYRQQLARFGTVSGARDECKKQFPEVKRLMRLEMKRRNNNGPKTDETVLGGQLIAAARVETQRFNRAKKNGQPQLPIASQPEIGNRNDIIDIVTQVLAKLTQNGGIALTEPITTIEQLPPPPPWEDKYCRLYTNGTKKLRVKLHKFEKVNVNCEKEKALTVRSASEKDLQKICDLINELLYIAENGLTAD